ncbi:MAG: dihydrodipicolinate synthase family protein [Anaerolineae bacterium]|nr:dihydrodipicolinate synthase family protein [Anaerolineae bacterium]
MTKLMRGYAPIVPTPYTDDNQVDLASLRRLTEYLVANGAQGMSPNGGDSEARHLSEGERQRAVDAVMEVNAGRIFVNVGASAPTTGESKRLCQYAQRAGADGVFVMPPGNWRGTLTEEVSDEEMLAHYETVCDGLDIPMMIHATRAMDVPFLVRLIERIPAVQYVKEETTHGPKLRRYVRELGDKVTLFGPGLHYPAELEWGAMGVMPSCCAVHSHGRVFDLWQAGRVDEARATWNRMLPLVFWRWRTSPQEAGKWFLMHEGVFETRYTRPEHGKLVLDEADYREMLRVLDAMGGEPW